MRLLSPHTEPHRPLSTATGNQYALDYILNTAVADQLPLYQVCRIPADRLRAGLMDSGF
jgi:hypothetical protein